MEFHMAPFDQAPFDQPRELMGCAFTEIESGEEDEFASTDEDVPMLDDEDMDGDSTMEYESPLAPSSNQSSFSTINDEDSHSSFLNSSLFQTQSSPIVPSLDEGSSADFQKELESSIDDDDSFLRCRSPRLRTRSLSLSLRGLSHSCPVNEQLMTFAASASRSYNVNESPSSTRSSFNVTHEDNDVPMACPPTPPYRAPLPPTQQILPDFSSGASSSQRAMANIFKQKRRHQVAQQANARFGSDLCGEQSCRRARSNDIVNDDDYISDTMPPPSTKVSARNKSCSELHETVLRTNAQRKTSSESKEPKKYGKLQCKPPKLTRRRQRDGISSSAEIRNKENEQRVNLRHTLADVPRQRFLSMSDAPSSTKEWCQYQKTVKATESPISTVRDQHPDLRYITSSVLTEMLDGKYNNFFKKIIVVDCRFDYEYQGGHIRTAINVTAPEQLEEIFMANVSELNAKIAIVFHCEFSSKRGPQSYRCLRKMDRQKNISNYPALYYPYIYCLKGGYKEFFGEEKTYCEPQAYVPMTDNRFKRELRKSEARRQRKWKRSKSFCGFENIPGLDMSAVSANHHYSDRKPLTERTRTYQDLERLAGYPQSPS